MPELRIILGSRSPRRRDIMNFFSLPFVQVASDFDEESVPFDGNPVHYVQYLSQKKAETLVSIYPNEIILTADSAVFCNGKIYNKPANAEEAKNFLHQLCGQWQQVFTGVCVRKGPDVYYEVAETKLRFHHLTDEQIRQFHKHCHFLDKAGGYAIEKSGNLIVEKIEGCYYNVMGLPIHTTQKLLLKVGIDLWDYLKDI